MPKIKDMQGSFEFGTRSRVSLTAAKSRSASDNAIERDARRIDKYFDEIEVVQPSNTSRIVDIKIIAKAPRYAPAEISIPHAPSGYLVSLLTDPSSSEDFLANMEDELYPRWVKKYGEARARRIWHAQCIRRVIGDIGSRILQVLPWIKKPT